MIDNDETPAAGTHVKCGCGLRVSGDDPNVILEIMRDHECTSDSDGDGDGDRWWHHLFSLYGLLMVIAITTALATIFRHGK